MNGEPTLPTTPLINLDDPDTKVAMWSLLSIGALFLSAFMWGRRRTLWAVTTAFPTRDWHPCAICQGDKLIRPHQFLCDPHWHMVPVLLRNWLGANRKKQGPQTGNWLIQAKRAIEFVEDYEDRMFWLRDLEPGSRVP